MLTRRTDCRYFHTRTGMVVARNRQVCLIQETPESPAQSPFKLRMKYITTENIVSLKKCVRAELDERIHRKQVNPVQREINRCTRPSYRIIFFVFD